VIYRPRWRAGTAIARRASAGCRHEPNEVLLLAGVFLDADGIINKLDGTPNDPGIGVPYSALRDGVNESGSPLLSTFPYAGTPISPFAQRATIVPYGGVTWRLRRALRRTPMPSGAGGGFFAAAIALVATSAKSRSP